MAEFRFSCPGCHQHITCDEAWGGHSLQCPACGKTITAPAAPQPSKPASSPGGGLVPKVPEQTRLSLNQNAQQPASVHQKNIPIRNLAGPVAKKESPWKTVGIVAAILVILGVSGYFGWPHISKLINKEKPQEQASSDAKPAAAPEAAPAPAEPGEIMPGAPPEAKAESATVITNIAQTGPVIPAVHTLEAVSVRIPSGRVNGKVSGGDFVPEIVRIDPVGPTQVLRFSQGELLSPDRELLIYLRLKTGEKLVGQKIAVSADLRATGLPQVMKRWKTNPKYAPTSRSFSSGYVMKLEFKEHARGVVKGSIYLALPDRELTVAAGNFAALTTIPEEGIAAPGTPINPGYGQPGPGQPVEAGAPMEMERRYAR